MKNALQKSMTAADGQKIAYFVSGNESASPVVLIHGFPASHFMWDAQVEALAKDHRVITLDLRGAGKSLSTQGPFTMEILVDDLMQLLTEEKIASTAVMGFSMGGYLALRAVEREPSRFSSLILANTTSTPDSNESKLKRTAALKAVKADGVAPYVATFLKAAVSPVTLESKPELLKSITQMLVDNANKDGVIQSILALISRTDTTLSLANINIPTLIIVGDGDSVTPLTAAEAMQKQISGSKLKVITQAGHMSPNENPKEFNAAILEFLAK